MSALRILHVDTGRDWRGGQAQVALLVQGLASRGHVQAVAAPAHAPLGERLGTSRLEVPRIPFAPRSDLDLLAMLGLVTAARRFGPDVVHLHDARAHATGWLAAHAARAGCVVSRRVAFSATGRAPHAWKYRRLAADRWHAISRAVKDELVGLGVPEARIAVVPDAVDVAATEAAANAARTDGRVNGLRERWGAKEGTPLFGVVAALTAEKGHDVLLEAWMRLRPRVPGARLVIVGEGPERAALERRAEHLGVAPDVSWVGRVEDLPAALAAFDGLVVPSRAEGFGSIALLARAAGVPVVASAVGGLPEALDDGDAGRLVRAGDPAALAGALEEIALDPAKARACAARARITVVRFDVSETVPRFEALYREIAPT